MTAPVATRDVVIQLNAPTPVKKPASQGTNHQKTDGKISPMKDATSQDTNHQKTDDKMSPAKDMKAGDSISKDRKKATSTARPSAPVKGTSLSTSTRTKRMMPTAKSDKMLPNTGESQNSLAGMGVLGIALAGILSSLGLAKKGSKK